MSLGYLPQASGGKPDYKVPVEEPVICILNKEKKHGVLKFIGETHFSSGIWCGVALREACGKNDGSIAGIRYFHCDEQHGIFVTPKNVFSAVDELKPAPEVTTELVMNDKKPPILNKQETYYTSAEESRPRSKSDAVISEKKNASNVFSNSPFKCNTQNAKSLSKLHNVTYVCSSPVLTGTERQDLCEPTFCVRLVSGHSTSNETCETALGNVLNHLPSDLSPKFEVKQSIKLESINSARFSAPAGLEQGQESKLNETFLVNTKSPSVERKPSEDAQQTSEKRLTDGLNESLSDDNTSHKKEIIVPSSSQENLNVVSDAGRPRSVSKSSWSSVESLSSVGSRKSNKERSCLDGTKTPRKLPCPGEFAKSKLVKISTEKNQKSKDAANKTQGVLKTVNKPVANDVVAKKSRIKSTSVVAARSALTTPSTGKTALKPKSKSVSTDVRDRQSSSGISRLNASKFATPLTSKVSTAPSSRLTSTPIGKKPTTLEKKQKLTSTLSVSSRSMKSSSQSEPRSVSRENSNVENKVPSMKNKSVTSSIKKENESKCVVNKSRNYISSVASKENKHAKSRTLSTSAVPKAARGRNLSASCTTKEEIKPPTSKLRSTSSSKAEGGISKTYGLKSSIKPPAVGSVSENLSASNKSLSRKIKTGEPLSLQERTLSDETVKKRAVKEKHETTGLRLGSAATPDILKQTPEVTRHSVAIQVDPLPNDETSHQLFDEQGKVLLAEDYLQRNREFEACLIALQVYAQKVDDERENASLIRKDLKFTKERYFSTENMLVRESNLRAHLEEEMLSAKSDSVVEVALLRAEYERKQEIMQVKLKESHKKDIERVRKQHIKSLEDVRHSCDMKLKRIEKTYVEDIAQINEKHRDVIAELELQHSKHVDDLVEERHAEIETIKADYDEQMERIQKSLSESEKSCNELEEKLRITEEEAKRDIELRIQDAIAKYKSLPDELESTKFVLEMKNNEVKQLRKSNAELQNKVDELQQIKERAALLEREKESLNFVVENKAHFERQLCLERDKLRLNLNREVAVSKRLSLENEELAWRLNSFQNSPTSPTTSADRLNWKLSAFNTPDNAMYSQKIGESDFEYEVNDSKEIES